jgi:hypothetical protein
VTGPLHERRLEDRWALDDIAELAGFHRDAHPAEVVAAVRAALAARTPQPAVLADAPVVGTKRRSPGRVERWDGRRWVPVSVVAGATHQEPDRAPQPAVADGEDVPARLAERVEAAAQVLHERRHPLGYGQVCGRCRADARAVLDLLETR